MLVRVSGDNIMMSPPFIMTPSEIDEVSCTTIPQYDSCHPEKVNI